MENFKRKLPPFLRWAGSKRKILPQLLGYWNERYNRYIEAFTGSGCFFFSIEPQNSIISDINYELINTYHIVKKYPKELYAFLQSMPLGKNSYYVIRKISPSKLNLIERAARFMYLNRFAFNGLYRTNLKGEFNVPYGPMVKSRYPSLETFLIFSKKLERTKIFCSDFQQIISLAKDGDFIYLDPPYALKNSRSFYQYDRYSFSSLDIQRLCLTLDEANNKGVHFVVSYAYSDEVINYFKKWKINETITTRNIRGFATDKKFAKELIITNIY
jgi:DNA adenine methylase